MYNGAWLAHHGIKGQRWGIRRFQREDGSRTTAGKKRRDVLDNRNSRTTSKQRKAMTDDQLKKRIERLKLEKELKNLEHDTMNSGKAFTEDVMKSSGKKILTQVAVGGTIAAIAAGVTVAAARASAKANGDSFSIKDPKLVSEVLGGLKGFIPKAKDQW